MRSDHHHTDIDPEAEPAETRTAPKLLLHRRSEHRFPVRIRGLLYHGGIYQTTMIENLSTKGAGLRGASGIAPGDSIAIQLLDGRELTGEVRWWLAGRCGIEFHTPIQADDPLFKRQRVTLD